MKPGDYACLPVTGMTGRLISAGEWLNGDGFGPYDHAQVYVGLPDSAAPLGYTMGAYPGGARLVPVPRDQHDWLWSHFDLTQQQRDIIVRTALACKGIDYSSVDYFALIAHRLHLPIPGLRDFIADSGHMICSQLVDFCYLTADFRLFTDGRWDGYVTPMNLANLIHA